VKGAESATAYIDDKANIPTLDTHADNFG